MTKKKEGMSRSCLLNRKSTAVFLAVVWSVYAKTDYRRSFVSILFHLQRSTFWRKGKEWQLYSCYPWLSWNSKLPCCSHMHNVNQAIYVRTLYSGVVVDITNRRGITFDFQQEKALKERKTIKVVKTFDLWFIFYTFVFDTCISAILMQNRACISNWSVVTWCTHCGPILPPQT